MPELPEVQTTVNDLQKKLVGLRFKDVWTDWPKTFRKAGGFEGFKKAIKNKKILDVRRRAKFIIIDIDPVRSRARDKVTSPKDRGAATSNGVEGKYSIFIHQKISGHLLYGKWQMANDKWQSIAKGPLKNDSKNGFIRTIWLLSNGFQLAFSDL